MRIVMAIRTSAHVGGIESYVALAAGGLTARGHDVRILAEDDEPDAGGRAHALRLGRAEAGNGAGADRLLERLRAFRPEVVLSHGLSDPALESRIVLEWPTAFFAHVYHGTCVGGSKTCSWPSPSPCVRPIGAACLLHYFPRRCGGLSPVTMLRQFDLQRRRLAVVKRCRAVVTLSQHIAEEYARNGVEVARVHRLAPVVQLPPTPPLETPPDPVQLVYLGRLERLKGPRILLDALGPVSGRLQCPVHATFAGEGACAAALRRRARSVERGASEVSVAFAGKLTRQGVQALLSTATLLVVPSVWPEPFGLVGLEAASHGVPAVAFAVGGIPEWLRDGVTGHLAAPPGSAASLGDAIVRALADPSHYAALRCGARAEAERAASGAHVVQLERVLESIARPLAGTDP